MGHSNHYSGHGTRQPSTGAFAFVLYDHYHGEIYLYGEILESMLKKMTAKNLIITLILDCCFSDSSWRYSENNAVRCIDFNPTIDVASPEQGYGITTLDTSQPLRDAHTVPLWLANPNYTILTACGPHEIAQEIKTRTLIPQVKEKRGALSYFLLEALFSLRRSKVEVTYSSLHQHLLMKFHTHWPCQTPMRRGNKKLMLFRSIAAR